MVLRLVGIHQAAEMARFVVIFRHFTNSVDELGQLPESVVLPMGGFERSSPSRPRACQS